MRTLLVLAVTVLITLVAGALVLYSGFYNIAATEQHTAPVYWLLETGMRQSVRRHARAIAVPPLADPRSSCADARSTTSIVCDATARRARHRNRSHWA